MEKEEDQNWKSAAYYFLLLRTGNKKQNKNKIKQGKYQIKHKASVCSQHWWQENVREEDWERHWKKQMASSDWLTKHFKWRISQVHHITALPSLVSPEWGWHGFLSHRTERTRASRWHYKPIKHGRVSLTWSNQLWWTTRNNRNNCRICAGHKQPGGTGHSMTTCTWPKLSNDDGSYIAILSALKQTHCTFVACDSEWVTAAFYSVFWMSTEAVCLLHCLVVT